MELSNIIAPNDLVLVTGSTGFIGPYLVESLLRHGFRNIRAFARPSSDTTALDAIIDRCRDGTRIEVIKGNLMSREDCTEATKGAAVILHLATSGDKSFAGAFMNSVVTTRNLLEASLQNACLRRFVNISSFAVYSNTKKPNGRILDESSPVETQAAQSGEAYCFAKVKQDEIVIQYGKEFGIPYVILRPGSVYGPGKSSITGRVGIDTFGVFLHMGGSNLIPLTYVENCADAIVLAGIKPGVEGEVFNIVDDDLISSRKFLRLYKRKVKRFPSVYVPHVLSYGLCAVWEKYARWSKGQLPSSFNRRRWHAEWKSTRYSNEKLKTRLGWTPKVNMNEGLARFFESAGKRHA